MRNFYLTAGIDGRKTTLCGGPRAKDGEMTVEVRQRDEGSSVVAFTLYCHELNGVLTTYVRDGSGKTVAEFTTNR